MVRRGVTGLYCLMPDDSQKDPLLVLRQYRQFAPWNLHDLASLAGALLDASGVRPTSAAAQAHPGHRTIRYYIAKGLMTPPEGRGTAATYSYRHLLQILLIKLRQMEGAPLTRIAGELEQQTGDVIERRVASALGPGIAAPSQLAVANPETARGRAGRALHSWAAVREGVPSNGADGTRFATTKWHRIPIVRGLELHVHEGHPLAKHVPDSQDIADAVRIAVNRVLMRDE
jgi:DNA-binding transcriptional MerR regulator